MSSFFTYKNPNALTCMLTVILLTGCKLLTVSAKLLTVPMSGKDKIEVIKKKIISKKEFKKLS